MKKLFILVGLMVGVLVMVGCAPNLISYPPTAINPSVVEGFQNFKLSSQMPNEEYGIALKSVIEHTSGTILIYQEKLFPVFNQMHQKYQKRDYDGVNVLIAKARGYNAEWYNSFLALKNALEKLSEVNKKVDNSAIKAKTEQLVDFGKSFVDEVLSTQNAIRELLDIVEGYDKARVEMNLSYLTKENEQRFNNLSQNLHLSGEHLNEQVKVLFQLLVEFNDLLSKEGGR